MNLHQGVEKTLVKGSTIIGNVQSDEARRVRLRPDATTGRETVVNGSIQLRNTVAGDTSTIQDVWVGGSIQIEDNAGPFNLFGNEVNQDVQVFQNTAVVRIRDNTIDGNLQCRENTPRPLNGGGNVVDGNAEDQCAGFDRVLIGSPPQVRALGRAWARQPWATSPVPIWPARRSGHGRQALG